MPGRPLTAARGVLRTPPAEAFELWRWDPSPATAPHLSWLWAVRWDLRGREPHRQATLPHPSPHVVVEGGAAYVQGPLRRRFEATLEGAGRTVGARLRPGALRPLLGAPVASITDRRLPASALPGLDGGALARAVGTAPDLDAAVDALESVLAGVLPERPDADARLADRAVALVAEDRSLTTVAALARRLGLSVRSVHRLFADYVGLGPAWVMRRSRLQEAAEHATAGDPVEWARLAAELGYADQAHLVRDFTAAVGEPPARYSRG